MQRFQKIKNANIFVGGSEYVRSPNFVQSLDLVRPAMGGRGAKSDIANIAKR